MTKKLFKNLGIWALSLLLMASWLSVPGLAQALPDDEVDVEELSPEEFAEEAAYYNALAEEIILSANGEEVSLREANFHAALIFQQLVQAPPFGPEGQLYFDLAIPTEDGEEPLIDIIKDIINTELPLKKIISKRAKAEGISLTDEDQAILDNFFGSLRNAAQANNQDVETYLSKMFGPGSSEDILRTYVSYDLLQTRYFEHIYNDFEVTQEDLEAEYKSNPNLYDLVSYRLVPLNPDLDQDDLKDLGQTLEKVDNLADFFAALTKKTPDTEESLEQEGYASLEEKLEATSLLEDISYEILVPEVSFWLFEEGRVESDTTIINAGNGPFALYFLSRHKNELRNYSTRHILISQKGTNEDDRAIAEATAEAILAAYEKNPSEEYFSELATKYSEDPGSKANAGLYEDVAPGSFVVPYEDFALAEDRSAGDVSLVYSESSNYSGYHLIYFVGLEAPNWERQAEANIRSAHQDAFLAEIEEEIEVEFVGSGFDHLLEGPYSYIREDAEDAEE